jgi:hypothetical protein
MSVRMSVDGLIRRVDLAGHFPNTKACAALSSLVRTLAKILDRKDGVEISGAASEPGDFHMDVKSVSGEARTVEWVRGVTAFFMCGLNSLKIEMGQELDLSIDAE